MIATSHESGGRCQVRAERLISRDTRGIITLVDEEVADRWLHCISLAARLSLFISHIQIKAILQSKQA